MRKIAFTACSDNLEYLFYLPFAAAFWKNIGYDFHYILSTNQESSPINCLVKSVAGYFRAEHDSINFIDISDDHLAPFLRIFCSHFMFWKSPDFVLTTDVDMMPLQDFFDVDPNFDGFHIYGENPPGYGDTRYPICYIGGTVKTWNEYEMPSGIRDEFQRCQRLFGPNEVWSYDELLFRRHVQERKIPIKFIGRDMIPNPGYHGQPKTPGILPVGRLDRSNWQPHTQNRWLDAHCPRPGSNKEHWPKVKWLIDTYLPGQDTKVLIEYRNLFVSLIQDGNDV